MGRKFFVGGNWKMNGTKAGIDSIIDFLSKGPLDPNAGEHEWILTVLCVVMNSKMRRYGLRLQFDRE
jgi:hypothetical protein